MTIRDPEARILAGISEALRAEYASEDQARGESPFEWINSRPSRQVGAIGEKAPAPPGVAEALWRLAFGCYLSAGGDDGICRREHSRGIG